MYAEDESERDNETRVNNQRAMTTLLKDLGFKDLITILLSLVAGFFAYEARLDETLNAMQSQINANIHAQETRLHAELVRRHTALENTLARLITQTDDLPALRARLESLERWRVSTDTNRFTADQAHLAIERLRNEFANCCPNDR